MRQTILVHLRIAIRSLLRQRKRTAMTMSAVAFGVIALLLAGGFIEWVFWAMRESTIQGRLGHIQITRPGYYLGGTADPFAYLLPASSKDFDTLAHEEHVKILTPRLAFTGLISTGEVTLPFIADAGDPVNEKDLSVDFRIREGEGMSAEDPSGIIMGAGLAAAIDVKPGDVVTLLATISSGGFNAIDATVRGIFSTSNKIWNETALRTPLELARKLLRVDGAHVWVMLLDNTENTDEVLKKLHMQFANAENRYEFKPWYEMADFYTKTVKLFSRQMWVIQGIIALIVILGISNTMMMNIAERTGEIGTLQAIGTRRGMIINLFVTEGLLIGIIAGILGLVLGLLLAKAVSAIGIPMPPAPGMDKGYYGKIMVTAGIAVHTFLLAVVTSLLASIYPAWKASRLEIVDALRHNI